MDTIVIKDASETVSPGERLVNAVRISPTLSSDSFHGNPAKWLYERLVKIINDFEENLTNDYQAGVKQVTFNGQSFAVDGIDYSGNDLIIFYGRLQSGEPLWLLQHITQVNLLLVAVPRTDDTSKPRRKIGFVTPEQE